MGSRPAMMASLLRHGAARRVGGSVVQLTRAAFTTPAAPAERRLLTTEHARPGPPKDPQASLREIEYRKEELYDLISLMEKTSMPKTYQNRELLKFLSKQVKPKPHDSQWRRMRQLKKSDVAAETGMLVAIGILGYQYWYVLPRRKEVALAAMKQEQ